MYKLGVWSLSNHFINKVLPSIKNNPKIKIIKVYTNKYLRKNNIKLDFTNSLDNFLNSDFDFVYISSINSNHFKNCKIALENKKNVICEKPICLKPEQLNRLKNIAEKNKKIFLEMNQYTYHPLFKNVKKKINKKKLGKIFYVKCNFEIPLKDKKNFRFNKKLGGGALYDVGYYPISILYTVFDSKKIEIIEKKIIKNKKIDYKGNAFLINNDNIAFDLSWSLKDSYKNFIHIYGEEGFLKSNFFFSKKIVQNGQIELFINKTAKTEKIKRANQINLAFIYMMQNKLKLFNDNYNQSLKILKTVEKLKN